MAPRREVLRLGKTLGSWGLRGEGPAQHPPFAGRGLPTATGSTSATSEPWLLASAFGSQHARGLRSQNKQLPIVLRRSVGGLGRPGDVVKVSSGFARNALIPYKWAFPALDKYVKAVRDARDQGLFKDEESEEEAEEVADVSVSLSSEDRAAEAGDVARRLDASRLSIRRLTPRRSTQLREPVQVADIIAEVSRQLGVELAQGNISLPSPLQTVGTFEIPVEFPEDVPLPGGKEQVFLKVNVRRK